MILYRENTNIILDYENGNVTRVPVGSLQALRDGTDYVLLQGINGFLTEPINLVDFKKFDLTPYTKTELDLFLSTQGFVDEITGGGGTTLQIVTTDPIAPALGDGWILETINPAGTLSALVGGFPIVTQSPDLRHDLSYNTTGNIVKRVILQ